jgi:small subunit ribosomal protein S21
MNRNKPKGRGTIIVVGDLPLNVALRKFKQKVDDLGILEIVKENMFFEKPTTVRKRKKGAARARWRKKMADQQLPKKLF